MSMKKPPSPGRLLQADIASLGLSVADVAVGLGVTRQHLYNVLNGKSAITPDMAVRLEAGIGSTAEAWLRLQAAYDLSLARSRIDSAGIRRMELKHADASLR